MSTAILTACLVCGSGNIGMSVSSKIFSYKGESISFDGFTSYECHECGESFPDKEQLNEIEPKIRDFHRKVDGLLTSQEIKSIRKSLGYNQDRFGNILGGGEKAFARYENGTVTQSRPMDNLLKIIRAIPSAMDVIYPPNPKENVFVFKQKMSHCPPEFPYTLRLDYETEFKEQMGT